MEKPANSLLLAYYGDDFTGSTDALEFLTKAGIKTMLFIEAPTKEQLANHPNLQAIGVAGMSRTMSPIEMEAELTPAFAALKNLNPRHVHYKVCSTFDSSTTVGSIGKAIAIGVTIFNSKFVPVLVAAPVLGRFMCFGNLFARMGIGSNGGVFRLDRHPSMSKHPVTPADESDIALHLAKQTEKTIRLFDILALHQYQKQAQEIKFDTEIVLFDAIEQKDLTTIGEVIEKTADKKSTIFSVGSSGIEMALGAYWQQSGLLPKAQNFEIAKIDKPILVLSGSCSAVTSNQISFALQNGFTAIAIDTVTLANNVASSLLKDNIHLLQQIADDYAVKAIAQIQLGKNTILHTSLGNDDIRVFETDKIFKDRDFDKSTTAKLYGTLLGLVAKFVVEKTATHRIIVAGGDTSSYAARAMEIEAVEMICPLSPGAPLCKAFAPNSPINHLQIAFKGGQVGKEDFFLTAAKNIEPNLI